MLFERGVAAVQPQVQAVRPPVYTQEEEDRIYDSIFKAYINQDMFADEEPENANASPVDGAVKSSQIHALQEAVQADGSTFSLEQYMGDTIEGRISIDDWPENIPENELSSSVSGLQLIEALAPTQPSNRKDDAKHGTSANLGNSSFQFAVGNMNFGNAIARPREEPLRVPPAAVNVPTQVQPPNNGQGCDINQFMAYYASLPKQNQASIYSLLATAAAAQESTQPGIGMHQLINGLPTTQVQANKQTVPPAVYRPNLTAATNVPPPSQVAGQSKQGADHNAVQAQAQAQMRPLSLNANFSFDLPNHQSQGKENKPAIIEYVEKSYGVKIRPEDYAIFTQGLSLNISKHYINPGNSQQPSTNGGGQLPFVQGSSRDEAALQPVLIPQKRQQEDVNAYTTFARRVRGRPRTDPSGTSSPSNIPSIIAEAYTTEPDADADVVDTLFVPVLDGEKPGFYCGYKCPVYGGICNAFMAGKDKRNRHRHLATHAVTEEELLATGRIDKEDVFVLTRLPKLVVSCNIKGCDFETEVWRSDHVRENHEKIHHLDVYLSRVRERREKRARKSALGLLGGAVKDEGDKDDMVVSET